MYKNLCFESSVVLKEIIAQTNLNLPVALKWEKNHAIAGNPVRKTGGEIKVRFHEKKYSNINFLQMAYFKLIAKISNSIFR